MSADHLVILEETFMVTICNENAERDWPTVKVNPLVKPFKDWLNDQELYEIKGTYASGPHFYTGTFPAEDKEAIEAYFDGLSD